VPADLILITTVRTMDDGSPLARAIAVTGGRITAVGDVDTVLAQRGARTDVRDLPGTCVLPGFHDAHVHLAQHGLGLSAVTLADAPTLATGLERVAARVRERPAGTWIVGAGFSLQRWGLRTLHRDDLDRVAPNHPVYLRSQDHHAAWANTAALRAAGLDERRADPEAGTIVRDGDGTPTGYLLERAGALVSVAMPAPDADTLARAVAAAGRDLAARGITTVHHMAYEPASYWRAIADAASRDDFELRVWACIDHGDLEHASALGLAGGHGGDGFVVGGAKFFADGALGSRTAWMLEPYAGGGGTGVALDVPDVLERRYRLAAEAGFASVTHAIGDAAVRATLDALEATADAWRPRGLRPRVEHVQHLHPDDVPRFAALGAVASMQPIHLTFDAASIRTVLPDRLDRAYRMRSLRDAGAVLAFGSDTPVAPPDVLAGLRAAVSRRDVEGETLAADQALDVAAAVAGFTRGAAYAIGREHRSGRVAEGADADLVVLDHDPWQSLDDLAVILTVKGGRVTYDAT
jgi:predicted amidohydrolase YtcJ